MSLINDALKRAKEVHRQNPPAPPSGPPLRPVERQPQQHPHLGLLLVFAVVVAGAAILLWQGLQQWRAPRATDSPTHTAAPVAPPDSAPTTPTILASSVATSAPAIATPGPGELAETAPPSALPSQPVVAPPTDAAETPASEATATPTTTPSPPPAEPDAVVPAPAPLALKLQAIVYHPSRASAAINGKVLFVGDRLSGWRVTAITPEEVTLVSEGRTNVLTLDH